MVKPEKFGHQQGYHFTVSLSDLCNFGKVSQSNFDDEGVRCQQWSNEKLTIFLKYSES